MSRTIRREPTDPDRIRSVEFAGHTSGHSSWYGRQLISELTYPEPKRAAEPASNARGFWHVVQLNDGGAA